MADSLHDPIWRGNVKGAGGPYSNPSDIRADILSSENLCTHEIARLEALHALGLFGACSWEAILVHAAHLPAPMACRRDEQWYDPRGQETRRGTLADASGINPVGFVESL